MKAHVFAGGLLGLVVSLAAMQSGGQPLPAFPGADGAARFATGGRGGVVYHVTKLDRNFNDASEGTLRYGLTDGNFPPNTRRTIVFDVAGVFWLGRYGAENGHDNGWNSGQSRYNLPRNVTVAGESAPGPVIIMGGVTKAGGTNTIIRNVMFAPGYGMQNFHEPPEPPTPGDFPDSYVYDAIDISGQNIMMDHLTVVYITDEAISCNELAADLTIQNSNVSQGQNYPQADAEASGVRYTGHALAHLLQAGSGAKISVLNNLYAHQAGRLPRVGSEVGTGAFNEFRNNVFYNWFGTAGSGASGQPSFNNFLHNFYLAGPGGQRPIGGTNFQLQTANGGTGIFSGASATATRVYRSGNVKDTNRDGDARDAAIADSDYTSSSLQASAYDISQGVTLIATNAFHHVLRQVGSRWWERDYIVTAGNTNAIDTIDERLIHETYTGTGRIIAWADDPFDPSLDEGTEWRSLLALRADPISGIAPFNHPQGWDEDADGIPNYWEIQHGLDPAVTNHNSDFDADGYTDLEEYLHERAAFPAPGVIIFNNTVSQRYAEIFNWSVSGVPVTVAGKGTVISSSHWQPSRFDSVIISNQTARVDAPGQHAGTLQLVGSTLSLSNGWLRVAEQLMVDSESVVQVQSSGGLIVSNGIVNSGTLRLKGSAQFVPGGTFTNAGVLDVISWQGSLPPDLVNSGSILDRSAIIIHEAGLEGSDFKLSVPGFEGHTFLLQHSGDFISWENAGDAVAGNGGTLTLSHPGGADSGVRLYRVVIDPIPL
ncbi:MAG TPA: hypothetical protein VEH04_00385 [Verrucomicrobiae bacterium]|nr:hypothetical protein [Verrucomicrobiae bacterium]